MFDAWKARGEHLLALAKTDIAIIQAASPFGNSNVSRPVKCRIGRGIQSTHRVKVPMRLPKVFANIIPRPGLVPSGGQAYFLYSTS